MPLNEILLLQLGPAIAKAILKVWLKDKGFIDHLAPGLVDVLKSVTGDRIAQRRGERLLEQIGEEVAASLLVLFEAEGVRLDEGGREAVAHKIAETLEHASIEPGMLAEINLEPAALADRLLRTDRNATRDFSEAETSLYRAMLFECSQRIIDVASQLPSFTERTFSEILKRESELLDISRRVLEGIQRIQEGSLQANREIDQARFESDYRLAVVRQLDRLELFGLDVSQASRRHHLSVAYITLSALVNHRHLSHDAVMPRRRPADADEAPLALEDSSVVPIDTVLAGSRRLVIRGQAGSGKTTLLQWIAVRSASKTFEGKLADLNDTIPFFIRLRQFAESELPAPEEFPGLIARAIGGTMPPQWAHRQLREGRAIVLIDGVDEVPKAQRDDVRAWLNDLVGSFEHARFVVTSRPNALEEGWLDAGSFDETELLPMELADIYSFIDHWHEAVREELHEAEERDTLEGLAEHLKEEVRNRRALRALATSPLLCAVLCGLHRDRHEQLPSNRIELYDACCELLLERRDLERRIMLEDYPVLSYTQKRIVLEELAYWLMRNGHSMISREKAEDRIHNRLMVMHDTPGANTRNVLQMLIDRSGMIREPVAGQIDFTHRTFQEFLAAKAALDDGDVGVLLKNALDDQWRETIILATGLARPKEAVELIKGLLDNGDSDATHRYQLHLLAVACLETAVELPPELRIQVTSRLRKLIPPRGMTEAKSLASAGILAVPFLQHHALLKSTEAAACVRTLALIGGEEALAVLETYTGDTRQKVIDELVKGWEYFDRKKYAEQILTRMHKRGHWIGAGWLRLSGVSTLEGVQYVEGLKNLVVERAHQLVSLEPLEEMKELERLHLTDITKVDSLGPLTGLVSLRDLQIVRGPRIKDLSPLRDIDQLGALHLQEMKGVVDLEPLHSLASLSMVTLYEMVGVTSIDSLAELHQLKSLQLSYLGGLEDLDALRALSSLQQLTCEFGGNVKDLRPLADLKQLSGLHLDNFRDVTDLSVLSSLGSLQQLTISRFKNIHTLDWLIDLKNMISLNLSLGGNINTLQPLTVLPRLHSLNLTGFGSITTLEPLSKLLELGSLELRGFDNVSDLSPIRKLEGLAIIELYGEHLTSPEVISTLGEIPDMIRLNHDHNNISFIKPSLWRET